MSNRNGMGIAPALLFIALIGLSSLSLPMEDCPKWPDQAQKTLNYFDLENCSCEELRILRNEIFARHGRKFKSEDLQKYFESQPWYKFDPANPSGDKNLNKFEIQNAKLIAEYENQIGCNLQEARKSIDLDYSCRFMGFKAGAVKTFKSYNYGENKYIMETERVERIDRENAFNGNVIVAVTSKSGKSYYEGQQKYEIQGYRIIPYYGDGEWVELPLAMGLKWLCDTVEGNPTRVVAGVLSVKTPAKTFPKCWELESEGGDSSTFYSYCEGAGLVKEVVQGAGEPKRTTRILTSINIPR